MAAYILADVRVTDPEAFGRYRAQVLDTLAPFEGRFLVRGGALEALEGGWNPERLVLIEFPSREQAEAWHRSGDYQAILPLRLASAETNMLLVEGTGPAPAA